jgi:hypothetical protein
MGERLQASAVAPLSPQAGMAVQELTSKADRLFVFGTEPSTVSQRNPLLASLPLLTHLLGGLAARGTPSWLHLGAMTTGTVA